MRRFPFFVNPQRANFREAEFISLIDFRACSGPYYFALWTGVGAGHGGFLRFRRCKPVTSSQPTRA